MGRTGQVARERRRGRGRDERGATLVFTAMCMVVLLWAGAVGIDVGFSVYGSRQAQAMADTAALDMARYINIADAQTTNPLVQSYLNGKLSGVDTDNSSNATLTVTPGLWLNGAWSVPGPGCAPTTPPAAHPCNAVMVTANQSVPQIFFGGFNVLSSHSGANATTIAAVTPNVCALTIGIEDYTADLGVVKTVEGKESTYARTRLVNAAKAAGVQAIDSVFGDVLDMDGLRRWGEDARALGFEGMGCIHPGQIRVIHEAFAPTQVEIDKALAIVAAFEEARQKGLGVVSLGSKMIDPPVVERAKKLVARAKQMGKA